MADAAAGHGSVVLVTGEAGIGKTSLVRAFAARLPSARALLLSACDDLMAPRTLGPLRDAAVGTDGPLAARWPTRPSTRLHGAAGGARAPRRRRCSSSRTSTGPTTPRSTCSATPRGGSSALRRVLVLTFRDDEVDAQPPAAPLPRRCSSGCPVHRLALRAALAARGAAAVRRAPAPTPDAVHRVTRGNPFFVTEALASPADDVPVERDGGGAGARAAGSAPECRDALDQLSVVPSHGRPDLAEALLGPRLDALAEAERAGVIEVRADSLAFRHELARRGDRAEPAGAAPPAAQRGGRARRCARSDARRTARG